jgi:hypothetical protein
MFWALPRFEGPGSGAFWPLGRVPAKGGCRLREWNRVGGVPLGIDRMTARAIGAVPGRTSRDG